MKWDVLGNVVADLVILRYEMKHREGLLRPRPWVETGASEASLVKEKPIECWYIALGISCPPNSSRAQTSRITGRDFQSDKMTEAKY